MNIEIANRLVSFRKKYGYSQEELANKLGVSRQAVSKWERSESSPDTDNLIELAKLYNCSLDDLLDVNKDLDDVKENSKNKKTDTNDKFVSSDGDVINISNGHIHIKDKNGEVVHIGLDGVHLKDKNGEEVHIGNKDYNFDEQVCSEDYLEIKKYHDIRMKIGALFSLIAIIVYLILGFSLSMWHPGWLIFLLVPVLTSIVKVFQEKRISQFDISSFSVFTYLVLGFYFDLWHPGWVVFFLIPLFYILVPKTKKIIYRKDGNTIIKDFGDSRDENVVESYDDLDEEGKDD